MKYDLAKTLFVTDLDGTLLRSDGTLAEETAAAFNCMAAAGMKLTFATARSYHTAMLVAGALQPQSSAKTSNIAISFFIPRTSLYYQ